MHRQCSSYGQLQCTDNAKYVIAPVEVESTLTKHSCTNKESSNKIFVS